MPQLASLLLSRGLWIQTMETSVSTAFSLFLTVVTVDFSVFSSFFDTSFTRGHLASRPFSPSIDSWERVAPCMMSSRDLVYFLAACPSLKKGHTTTAYTVFENIFSSQIVRFWTQRSSRSKVLSASKANDLPCVTATRAWKVLIPQWSFCETEDIFRTWGSSPFATRTQLCTNIEGAVHTILQTVDRDISTFHGYKRLSFMLRPAAAGNESNNDMQQVKDDGTVGTWRFNWWRFRSLVYVNHLVRRNVGLTIPANWGFVRCFLLFFFVSNIKL